MGTKIIGVVGWKDSGKTALVVALVEHLSRRGLRVATIKHAHHDFDTDQPGTDSYRHREAGAEQVMVASARRWVHLNEVREDEAPKLEQLTAALNPCDIIIVEGFKKENHPKVQVIRPSHSREPMPADVNNVIAIATDDLASVGSQRQAIPRLDLNNIALIADFICDHLQINKG